jgi:hypothetical protein
VLPDLVIAIERAARRLAIDQQLVTIGRDDARPRAETLRAGLGRADARVRARHQLPSSSATAISAAARRSSLARDQQNAHQH